PYTTPFRSQEQRDEEVSGWPEPVGQTEPEQHDHRHHDADTRRVPERPREPEPAGIEQPALSGGERRHRGEVVGLERVTESEQQAEARESEQAGTHGGPQFSLFYMKRHEIGRASCRERG